MSVLLIGLVCFLAALRVASGLSGDGDGEGGLSDVRGPGAVAWLCVIALATLVQLGAGGDELDRYRFTLLGFRYRALGATGEVLDRPILAGGDPDEADLWVPGAGDAPALELRAGGGDSLVSVTAVGTEDAAAVGLVEVPGLFGSSWRVLGGAPVGPRTAIEVRAPGGAWRIAFGSVAARVPFVDAEVPIPWVDQPVALVRPPGGAEEVPVLLPPLEASLVSRLRGVRPSVFQRTYPLADVLERAAPDAGLPPLGSFLYWRDDRLHVADVDSEVLVHEDRAGAAGGAPAEPHRAAVAWSSGEGGRRILVAGLPHRDYPEPDLELPERYGLRPLRSFGVDVEGPWIDVTPTSPEVRTLDREALEELRLPGSRDESGRPVYRIRLTPGRDALARRSVVFDAAPASFEAAGQAVFRLPEEPRQGEMHVLTPSGLARWETGRPLALGTGDRALLVRVDGLGTSAVFWLVHAGLFAMVAALFLLRPMSGPVFALALAVTGLASVRLLLGVSALAAYPHVQEGQQIGLWLLPLMPWAVVALAEASRPGPGDADVLALRGWRGWGFHVGYALVLFALAAALFSASPVKAVVLGAVTGAIPALWLAARGGWRPWIGAAGRLRRLAAEHPRLLSGWSLGAALLLLRVALEGAGWREQLTVGGTRIGVSVFYTPLVVATLAGLLWLHDRRIRAASEGPGLPRAVATALVEVGGFLVLAYVGVSGWVSDFGIALVLLPGALALLALVGAGRAPAGRPGRLTLLALGAPLLVFLLVQAAPPLVRVAWGDELRAQDTRLAEWNRNELLLLERGDPAALRMIGQRRSEALAVMRETMRSYTRGNLGGKGFLRGLVSGEVGETATREHAVSALLASQWGLPGALGLALLLLALLPPPTVLLLRDRGPGGAGPGPPWPGAAWTLLVPFGALLVVAFVLPTPFNTVVVGMLLAAGLVVLAGPAFGAAGSFWWGRDRAPEKPEAPDSPAGSRGPARVPTRDVPRLRRFVTAAALFTVAFAGLYMILANYGLAFFTGKNVYLLGLDSVGDALESFALVGLAALALGVESEPRREAEGGARADDGHGRGEAAGVGVTATRRSDEWWRDHDGGGG